MRHHYILVGLLLPLCLWGCSSTTAPQPPAPPTPVAQAPTPTPAQPVAPTAPSTPSTAQAPEAASGPQVASSLRAFFTDYYAARTRGDQAAVRAMTGGSYQARALATLASDQGTLFQVTDIQWWQGQPTDAEATPTVVRQRGKLQMGMQFRVQHSGERWRIVDLIDPATGRWLSDPLPQAQPFPANLQAGLDAQIKRFYQARSFQGGAAGVHLDALYQIAGDEYVQYLRNLLRHPAAQAEQYTVQGTKLLQWLPDGKGGGAADVAITRTLIALTKDGSSTSTTGDSRLRLQWAPNKDGTYAWRVVDGFLPQQAAWVSAMRWSGLLTAA